MTGTISESDWKLFCRFRLLALERFCERIFRDIDPIAAQTDKNWHERYKSLYKLVIESDGDLAKVFDDFRRSTAYFQLKQMHALGLLNDEEVMQFSSTAREWCDSAE